MSSPPPVQVEVEVGDESMDDDGPDMIPADSVTTTLHIEFNVAGKVFIRGRGVLMTPRDNNAGELPASDHETKETTTLCNTN